VAPKQRTGPRVGGLRGLFDGLVGARLCYGEPVVSGERAVIPVARVRLAGGGGYGDSGGRDEGEGGGGGGVLEATPQGFIELGADGARYHPIPDPDRLGRTLRTGAAAAATLATGLAAAKRLKGGARRPRALRSGRQ
jgi:Sporulation protein YtfJ (Spore_YtfJ)